MTNPFEEVLNRIKSFFSDGYCGCSKVWERNMDKKKTYSASRLYLTTALFYSCILPKEKISWDMFLIYINGMSSGCPSGVLHSIYKGTTML